jgi:hypothetical protein
MALVVDDLLAEAIKLRTHASMRALLAQSSCPSHIEILAQYDRLLVLHAFTPPRMLILILAQTNSLPRTT